MALATLQAIRNKVRKLTRSPSVNQITDAAIDEYVNTFIAFDFPESLRLFSLHKTLTFPLIKDISTYIINPILIDKFVTFNPPVYISGRKAFYTQSEEEFYNRYPFNLTIEDTGFVGDGITQNFIGTLSKIPVLRGKVSFFSDGDSPLGLSLYDASNEVQSVVPTTKIGTLSGTGTGTINYTTGAYTLNFNSPPSVGEPIKSQTFPYQAARPDSVLYFGNTFTFMPVPDQAYQVQIETYYQPTELMESGDTPYLDQWWQYIAYGASKKVFEDRMDMESVAMILPEFNKQERLVLRRTIVQQTNERAATIYTGNNNFNSGFNDGF